MCWCNPSKGTRMTKDEALQFALDSMKEIIHWYAVRDRNDVFLNFVDQNPEIQKIMKSITVIKEALETKEGLLDRKSYLLGLYDQKSRLGLETKDEPVALVAEVHISRYTIEWTNGPLPQGTKLYTTPQRKWVELTDEDMNKALDYWSDDSRSAYGGAHAANGEYVDMIETWRYIEAKLKEKNT